MSDEWMAQFADLTSLLGKRVRYEDSGAGNTFRVDPDTMEIIRSTYTIVVEGEVSGWDVGRNRTVKIAGYGAVPVDKEWRTEICPN